MLLNLETNDLPYVGWLIPDNPSAPSTLVIVSQGGRRRRVVEASDLRPDLRAAGLHATGLCGFALDAATYPELAPGSAFEIYDLASNTLIFRRSPGAEIPIRIFNLETQTHPVYALARHLSPAIQMVYAHVEMMSQETLSSVIRVLWPSVLLSGGALFRNYEAAFRHLGYVRTILLSDPARELAARLLRLKSLAADPEAGTGWRGLGQGGLIEAFADVDITNPAALGRILKRLDEELFASLANPTTRKLVANFQDLPLDKHHIGGALGSLASFDVVGFDDDLERYVDDLEAILGIDGLPRAGTEGPPELPSVMAAIEACRPAQELLELDEGVYQLARAAVTKETNARPVPIEAEDPPRS